MSRSSLRDHHDGKPLGWWTVALAAGLGTGLGAMFVAPTFNGLTAVAVILVAVAGWLYERNAS